MSGGASGSIVDVLGWLWRSVLAAALTLEAWINQGLETAPALVLGLAALVILPPLALIGVLLRGRRRDLEPHRDRRLTTQTGRLVMDGAAVAEIMPGRPMIRIGREDDNDIRLNDPAAHRYHALVHLSEDGDFRLVDLSGADGHGVRLNGAAVTDARLASGDRIEVMGRTLVFEARS